MWLWLWRIGSPVRCRHQPSRLTTVFLRYPCTVFKYILLWDRQQKVWNNAQWLAMRSESFENWLEHCYCPDQQVATIDHCYCPHQQKYKKINNFVMGADFWTGWTQNNSLRHPWYLGLAKWLFLRSQITNIARKQHWLLTSNTDCSQATQNIAHKQHWLLTSNDVFTAASVAQSVMWRLLRPTYLIKFRGNVIIVNEKIDS